MKTDEIRSQVAALRDEIAELVDTETLTEDQETRFSVALDEFEAKKAELEAAETRDARVAKVMATTTATAKGIDAPQFIKPATEVDVRSASRGELRDAALRLLEVEGKRLSARQGDHVEQLLRSTSQTTDGKVIAQRMLATENDAYRSAFTKAMTQSMPFFTAEEIDAVNAFRSIEDRAANEGTGSAGGFGVPVLIDPTIILTSGAVNAPILDICRTVTITTDAWKGVSSAAVSWSYDAEAAAVSDDATTLAQPNIPVYAARGFIPYSIEVGQDYPGFAEEMSMLLSQGFVDLTASQTVIGTGSSSPTGVFKSMQNVTTNPAHVTLTTAGTLGAVDIRTAWSKLPQRFRANAHWLYSPTVDAQIRAFAAGNLSLADFTVNLTADGNAVLTGKPTIVSDYAPAYSTTTSANNYAIVGDFSNFLFVQRAGMTVELVSHLFDTSTGRPTGQRGWFAYARHGHDVVNANAFRLLANS